jgi:serine/threonine protein kinase
VHCKDYGCGSAADHSAVAAQAVKRMARQILKGLEYLHAMSPPVVHGDLRCDKIYVNGHSGEQSAAGTTTVAPVNWRCVHNCSCQCVGSSNGVMRLALPSRHLHTAAEAGTLSSTPGLHTPALAAALHAAAMGRRCKALDPIECLCVWAGLCAALCVGEIKIGDLGLATLIPLRWEESEQDPPPELVVMQKVRLRTRLLFRC